MLHVDLNNGKSHLEGQRLGKKWQKAGRWWKHVRKWRRSPRLTGWSHSFSNGLEPHKEDTFIIPVYRGGNTAYEAKGRMVKDTSGMWDGRSLKLLVFSFPLLASNLPVPAKVYTVPYNKLKYKLYSALPAVFMSPHSSDNCTSFPSETSNEDAATCVVPEKPTVVCGCDDLLCLVRPLLLSCQPHTWSSPFPLRNNSRNNSNNKKPPPWAEVLP